MSPAVATERTYTTIDKTGWGHGPWTDEPDKIHWIDAASDLDCLIIRNRMGALCGYVGIPPEHPWHGKAYGASVGTPVDGGDDWTTHMDCVVEVHGGLTYANSCQEDQPEAEGICHVPLPGRAADVWWLGFDCGHCWDFAPGMAARMSRVPGIDSRRDPSEVYRDVGYVRGQCADLAAQLAGAAMTFAEVE